MDGVIPVVYDVSQISVIGPLFIIFYKRDVSAAGK